MTPFLSHRSGEPRLKYVRRSSLERMRLNLSLRSQLNPATNIIGATGGNVKPKQPPFCPERDALKGGHMMHETPVRQRHMQQLLHPWGHVTI